MTLLEVCQRLEDDERDAAMEGDEDTAQPVARTRPNGGWSSDEVDSEPETRAPEPARVLKRVADRDDGPASGVYRSTE